MAEIDRSIKEAQIRFERECLKRYKGELEGDRELMGKFLEELKKSDVLKEVFDRDLHGLVWSAIFSDAGPFSQEDHPARYILKSINFDFEFPALLQQNPDILKGKLESATGFRFENRQSQPSDAYESPRVVFSGIDFLGSVFVGHDLSCCKFDSLGGEQYLISAKILSASEFIADMYMDFLMLMKND